MRLLDGYIAKTVLSAIFLVTLMLAGLQIFILFVSQLGDIGKADYGVWQAARFVLLQLPYQIYLFFPMASLLGCLVGLGVMANHSELIVMRASGMSIGQVTWAVLKASMALVLLVTLLGEWWIPQLMHKANDYKTQAITHEETLTTAQGIWLRYKGDFISIARVTKDHTLHQVYQFHFDEHRHLRRVRKIERIEYHHGKWRAFNVAETQLQHKTTKARHYESIPWNIALKPAVLRVSGSEPDEMTLHELRQYLRADVNGQRTAFHYQLAYWQRIIQPFTTVVMMLLAIPFIFGPLRSSTMGSKLLMGATVGFGFHILNRFFGPISQVLQWPPELAAVGPTFLFAGMGFYLMHRVK